jgi:maltodextrin utilization protein YvdJ
MSKRFFDRRAFILEYNRMDKFTLLFWVFTFMFVGLSSYLLCCTKKSPIFYFQIASGLGIFATSKIGRKFLGIE